ncbi:hypothetical protein QBC43DRAFT_220027 [Cladorrhinum sp. PSN259]|nr:hypothetical protein QBC43DRAFT_220027 [Cladorrhinum sp. PSN259]
MTETSTRTPPQPPTLKKKASFRDRIKSWQKPTSTPLQVLDVIEEPKQQQQKQPDPPRFVYQPKHAAADFSRTAVPHARTQHPGWRPAPPRELEAVNGEVAVKNSLSHSQSRRRPTTSASNVSPHHDAPVRRLSQTSNPHFVDPFLASSAAAHIPINPYPVSWDLGAGTQPAERHPALRHEHYHPQQQLPVVVSPPHQRSEPQSDFERFLAEAEAKERARSEANERIRRSLSQQSQPLPMTRVPPNPHVQYASATSRSSSQDASGTTIAVAASRNSSRGREGAGNPVSNRRNSEHWHYGVDQIPEHQQSQGHRRTHTRNSSWTASYTTGASEEKKGAAVHVLRLDEKPAEQKALKRQVSISQKIAEYIRPPKQETVGLGDRMGSRHRRRVHTIEE